MAQAQVTGKVGEEGGACSFDRGECGDNRLEQQQEREYEMRAFLLGAIGGAMLLVVSGCATSTLSSTEAAQYANLSVDEFLRTRFNDRQSLEVGGTFRYLAYFNDANFRQLERPTVELWNFCRAGGGKLVRTEAHTGDPVGSYYTSPIAAAMMGRAAAARAGRPDLAADTAVQAVLINDQVNASQGAAEARKAFAAVRDKGAYGTWECEYAEGKRSAWRASVLPIAYSPPRDAGNELTNHRMIIEVAASRAGGR